MNNMRNSKNVRIGLILVLLVIAVYLYLTI
jgi:hypothetical protein